MSYMRVKLSGYYGLQKGEMSLDKAIEHELTDRLSDGQMETLRAEVDDLRSAFATLVAVLIEEGRFTFADLTRIGVAVEVVD